MDGCVCCDGGDYILRGYKELRTHATCKGRSQYALMIFELGNVQRNGPRFFYLGRSVLLGDVGEELLVACSILSASARRALSGPSGP